MHYMTVRTQLNENGLLSEPSFDGVFPTYDEAALRVDGNVSRCLKRSPMLVRHKWNEVRGKYCKILWTIVEVNDDLGFARGYTVDDCNRRKVPAHVYKLTLEDGDEVMVDVAEEDDWENIRRVCDLVGKNCVDTVGFGNDDSGIRRIESVIDFGDNGKTEWNGDGEVRKWYHERVAVYADNYCG